MKRRGTETILLTLALLLTLAAPASADGTAPSEIIFYDSDWEAIAGQYNGARVLGSGDYYKNDGSAGTSSDYNFAYRIEGGAGVITLNGYDGGSIQQRTACGTMRLVLIGQNTVADDGQFGIYLQNAELTVEGSGSLAVDLDNNNNGNSDTAYGISVSWNGSAGSLTLKDSVDVSVDATAPTGKVVGIFVGSALTVQDSAKLTVTAASEGTGDSNDGYAVRFATNDPTALTISTTQSVALTGDNTTTTPQSGSGEGHAVYGNDVTLSLSGCPSLTLRGRNGARSTCCLAWPRSIYETPPEGYMVTLTNMESNGLMTEAVFTPDTRVAIDPPAAATGLVYDGTEQTGVPAGAHYTLSGTTAETNPGSYTATATPDDGYKWSGDDSANSSAPRNIPWSIGKAAPAAKHFNLPVLEKPYTGIGVSVDTPTVKEPYTGMGYFSSGDIEYGGVESGSHPVEVGEYPVTLHVQREGRNFTTGDVTIGTLKIVRAENPIWGAGDSEYTRTKGSGTLDLSDCVKGAEGDVSWAITTALSGCSVSDAGVFTVGDTAGDCVVTATAAGNGHYEPGSVSWTIHVIEKEAKDLNVTLSDVGFGETVPDPTYTEPEGTQSTTVTYEGVSGVVYEKSAEKPTACGYYCVTVVCETETAVWTGTDYFSITAASISGATITLGTQAVYDGTEKDVVIASVTLNGETLTRGVDYTIRSGGKATGVTETTLTIAGDGNYAGTATKAWSLRKATPTADDFVLDEIDARDYNGRVATLSAPRLKTGKSGAGAVTVRYGGSAEAPVNAGSFTVTFDLAEGDNFTAATGLAWGTLNIRKTADPFTVSPVTAYAGRSVDLTQHVSGNAGTLSFAILGEAQYCSVTAAGVLSVGQRSYGTVTVRVTAAESTNHVETVKDVNVTLRADACFILGVSLEGGTMSWEVRLTDDLDTARLIGAWYDADGRLLGTAATTVTEAEGTLTVGEGAAQYRLMLLEADTWAPLCEEWRYTPSG